MSSEPKTYRHPRDHLYIGLGGTVFMSCAAIASSAAAYWNVDGSFSNPIGEAVFFGVAWSCFGLLGVYIIVAYFREQLTLDGPRITQRELVWTRTIIAGDVTSVKWYRSPEPGLVVLQSHSAKIAVYMSNFPKGVRPEIVERLRNCFPTDIQHHWLSFVDSNQPGPPPTPSRALAVICALLYFGISAVSFLLAIFLWQVGPGIYCGVFGAIMLAISLWYLWRIVMFKPN